MKRYCCHCGRYKTLDTFRNCPGVLCLFPTPTKTRPFWCCHGACGRIGCTTLRVLYPTKAHAKVSLIGMEGAIAQRTRKRCGAVRQTKLKVLQESHNAGRPQSHSKRNSHGPLPAALQQVAVYPPISVACIAQVTDQV